MFPIEPVCSGGSSSISEGGSNIITEHEEELYHLVRDIRTVIDCFLYIRSEIDEEMHVEQVILVDHMGKHNRIVRAHFGELDGASCVPGLR